MRSRCSCNSEPAAEFHSFTVSHSASQDLVVSQNPAAGRDLQLHLDLINTLQAVLTGDKCVMCQLARTLQLA